MKATPGMKVKYVMEISENVYNEHDMSKNCQNYPNRDFASYFDCEEHFLQEVCKKYGVAPIWLYKDFKNVTKDPVYSPGTCAFKRLIGVIQAPYQISYLIFVTDARTASV